MMWVGFKIENRRGRVCFVIVGCGIWVCRWVFLVGRIFRLFGVRFDMRFMMIYGV